MAMIPIVVITHGMFGVELLRTAQDIVGRQEGAAALTVTPDTGPDGLGKSLTDLMATTTLTDGLLIMVDMLGGTPCNVAMLQTKNVRAEILTGVNLYMLISAFKHRASLPLEALAEKAAEDARRAVTRPKELLRQKGAGS